MKKIMRTVSVVLLGSLLIFLGVYMSTHNMGVFNPKGIIALAERNLIVTALCLMLLVIVPVFILLGTFLWRYREGNTTAKYTPEWHSNSTLEIIWWTIPAVIIITLATITWKSTHDLDPFKPLDSNVAPITIQVVALDWKWLFIYPEQNIATVNFVEFPKDVPINFKITADAPMNAFWIPQLAGQVYAMSGMTAQLHLMANEKGDYRGLSSNFSGDGFSGMKFVARVTTREDFDNWIREIKSLPQVMAISTYEELAKQSKDNSVEYYASVPENLYNRIIMKFMMPMEKSSVAPTSASLETLNPAGMDNSAMSGMEKMIMN